MKILSLQNDGDDLLSFLYSKIIFPLLTSGSSAKEVPDDWRPILGHNASSNIWRELRGRKAVVFPETGLGEWDFNSQILFHILLNFLACQLPYLDL